MEHRACPARISPALGNKQHEAAPSAAEALLASATAGGVAAAEAINQGELDAETTDAPVLIRDPWEGFNRKVHGFNNGADKFVLRPLAIGYD